MTSPLTSDHGTNNFFFWCSPSQAAATTFTVCDACCIGEPAAAAYSSRLPTATGAGFSGVRKNGETTCWVGCAAKTDRRRGGTLDPATNGATERHT